jgi:hypothetical protein
MSGVRQWRIFQPTDDYYQAYVVGPPTEPQEIVVVPISQLYAAEQEIARLQNLLQNDESPPKRAPRAEA